MKRAPCISLWLGLLCSICAWGQPWPCDRALFMALTPAIGQPSELKRIIVDPNTGNPAFSNYFDHLNIHLNAIGYCVSDGLIYGLDPSSGNLYSIDASGLVTDFGVPNGLNTIYEYYAGDISPNGRNMFIIGRDRSTKVDQVMYSIPMDGPPFQAGYVSVVADWDTSLGDIAFDPEFGVLRGFDNATHRLVNLSTGGNITSTIPEGNGQVNIGSLFFDSEGKLFGYGSPSGLEDIFYEIDKGTGKVQTPKSWQGGRLTDGCSCPYRMLFYKVIEPAQVLPCTEIAVKYLIENTAGIAYIQGELRDTFPSDFTIAAIEGLSGSSIIESGVGTSILHIRKIQALLGHNEILVRVRVGSIPGVYAGNGYLGPFPHALGGLLLSDDPSQPGGPQATPLTIISDDGVIADSLLYLCQGSKVHIAANGTASAYLWSTGETTSAIQSQAPGWYAVTVTGPCGVFLDSVEVRTVSEPLFIDLGADQQIVAGDVLRLIYQTNGVAPLSFQWQADGDQQISCRDCPHPEAAPLQDTEYSVTITDAFHCLASDQVAVSVLPSIHLYLPSAFSPNDDGVNDVFFMQGKGSLGFSTFRVFDRWGGEVFYMKNGLLNDPAYGWDGKVKDKQAPAGAYLYLVEILRLDGQLKRFKGGVQLLR